MAEEKFHFGRWLRREVAKTGTSSLQFAQRIGTDESTLHRWYKKSAPNIRDEKLGKLATALKYPFERIEILLVEAMKGDPKMQKRWLEQEARMKAAGKPLAAQVAAWNQMAEEGLVQREGSVDWDRNVEPFGEESVPGIPTFDLPIAAGPWVQLPEVDQNEQKPFSADGRFRVRIRGNSMETSWPDGSLVEFRCLRPDCGDGRNSKLEVGADYYVQQAESATFKRLESFDEEKLVFVALNRKKYPAKIIVHRSDISRMAKAEYILVKPEK